MKTIADVLGGQKVDWRKELKLAKRRSATSQKTLALHKLTDWGSCACAQQDARLKREGNWCRTPEDDILQSYGVPFCGAVCLHDFDKALKILDKIEARAKELVDKLDAAE